MLSVTVVSMSIEALDRAIEICGGQTKLAARLSTKQLTVRQANISTWRNRDKKVPANMVLKIEAVTGVPRHELRPDIYPPEEYQILVEILQMKRAA